MCHFGLTLGNELDSACTIIIDSNTLAGEAIALVPFAMIEDGTGSHIGQEGLGQVGHQEDLQQQQG